LPSPYYFEEAAEAVDENQVAQRIICGPDPRKHIEAIQKYVDAGFDHIYVHQVGNDQEGFIKFYVREILGHFARMNGHRANETPNRRLETRRSRMNAQRRDHVFFLMGSELTKDVTPARRRSRALATIQGAYFTATGIWPLLHYRSFEKITGPKRDDWLVKTVGVMISCIGATLLLSAASDRPATEIRFLALSSAIGLCGIDTYFSATGRISKIYLLDAVAEVTLATAWLNEERNKRN
jgi:hypothetical protein